MQFPLKLLKRGFFNTLWLILASNIKYPMQSVCSVVFYGKNNIFFKKGKKALPALATSQWSLITFAILPKPELDYDYLAIIHLVCVCTFCSLCDSLLPERWLRHRWSTQRDTSHTRPWPSHRTVTKTTTVATDHPQCLPKQSRQNEWFRWRVLKFL